MGHFEREGRILSALFIGPIVGGALVSVVAVAVAEPAQETTSACIRPAEPRRPKFIEAPKVPPPQPAAQCHELRCEPEITATRPSPFSNHWARSPRALKPEATGRTVFSCEARLDCAPWENPTPPRWP